jgi:hypothetical protein
MPQLIQTVDEYARLGRFHKKPIGPLGKDAVVILLCRYVMTPQYTCTSVTVSCERSARMRSIF